jgi:hypothetical protein
VITLKGGTSFFNRSPLADFRVFSDFLLKIGCAKS